MGTRFFFRILLSLLVLLSSTPGIQAGKKVKLPKNFVTTPLRVCSYNIECPSAPKKDHIGYWPNRRECCIDLLTKRDFDLIGSQEASEDMLKDIVNGMPGYAFITYQRKKSPARVGIIYKTSRLELLDQGHFFFSPTPDEDFSWDPDDKQKKDLFCIWGRFRDKKTGIEFYHLNSHIHAFSGVMRDTLRCRDARLLKERLKTIAGDSFAVLTGDFNCSESFYNYVKGTFAQDSPGYVELVKGGILEDARVMAAKKKNDKETTIPGFSGTGPSSHGRTLDHIFVSRLAKGSYYVSYYEKIVTYYTMTHKGVTTRNGEVGPGDRFIANTSDHRPVAIDLYFSK